MVTPTKAGGTLFANLLDGNKEMFVFPDAPFFRLLTQRKYSSGKHMIMDWILGGRFPGHQLETELLNFDRNNEYIPIPEEYLDLPLFQIKLKGHLPAIENRQDCFSFDIYYKQLLESLKKADPESNTLAKDIIYLTVAALISGIKGRYKDELRSRKAWAFRCEYAPSSSLISKWKVPNEYIDDFSRMFPNGKIICLVRGPQGLMASRKGHPSFAKYRKKSNLFRRLYLTVQDASIINNTYEMLFTYLSQYSPQRLKVVSYEELCIDTENTMRNICDFIGISFSPVMELPTVFGRNTKVITARKISGNSVDKSRTIAWKKELTKFEVLLVESFIFDNRKKIKELWNYEASFSWVTVLSFRFIFVLPSIGVLRVLGWFHAKKKEIV